jgi:sulfide dehydrogenase cytochrome subunit
MGRPGRRKQEKTGDKPMKLPLSVWAAGLAVLAGAAQAADPNLGRNLAATCANCHGTNGQAAPGSGLEPLAGADKDRLLQKLNEFKTGARPATIMHQIAKGYTDEQLDLIATWFAARK